MTLPASTMRRQDHSPGTMLRLGRLDIVLDHSGCLFLPDHDALVVADLHFEKGSSFARRGQFVPPYDTHQTLSALEQVIARQKPEHVIALGDSFHDPEAAARLPQVIVQRLTAITASCHWSWIAGNHDPNPPAGIGGTHHTELELGGVVFRHEPEKSDKPQIAGHLHPCGRIVQRGRSIRRRAFVTDGTTLILPAFGALTGSLNCRHQAFGAVMNQRVSDAYLLADETVVRFPVRRLAQD